MHRHTLLTLAASITLSLAHAQRPNIILIMSDDMGFSDLGCYGGEIHTPNLDSLAEHGIRFTQFYNTARCCPTRASLMTGLYPHQTGIGHMTNTPEHENDFDLGLPGYRGFLNSRCVTIAEVMKSAGYTTLMTGKWHLGMAEESQWPLQRGFDRFYGILSGACNYFNPESPRGLSEGNLPVDKLPDNFYTTDAFTDMAITYIDESVRSDPAKPFFLYLAYNAPHWPLQAPPDDIARYRENYRDGWDLLRARRFERMTQMGIIDPSWELSPSDAASWDGLSPVKQEEMALRRAIYAAQVDRMDQNIGRLIAYLETNGLRENTVILFIDDNGACAEGGEFGGGPASQLLTREGYFLTYGRAWANASNTPFKRYKHWIHEGGISSPLIINWPSGISSENEGGLIKEYGFLPDIMATFIDLAGTAYPGSYQGNNIYPLEGKSLLPVIRGSDMAVHDEAIFWEHEGNRAVRLGRFKLVSAWAGDDYGNWELYDMLNDRTEMHDLAKQQAERVNEMAALWDHWAETHQVEPWKKIIELEARH